MGGLLRWSEPTQAETEPMDSRNNQKKLQPATPFIQLDKASKVLRGRRWAVSNNPVTPAIQTFLSYPMTKIEHGKILTKFLYKVRGILPMQAELNDCWDLVKSFAADIDARGYEKDVFEQWPNFKDVLSKRVKINQKARWN